MIYHDTQFRYGPYSHQIIKKNMVRHIKTAFEKQKQKQKKKKNLRPPFSLSKRHDPPHILPPPPPRRNNEWSLTTQ